MLLGWAREPWGIGISKVASSGVGPANTLHHRKQRRLDFSIKRKILVCCCCFPSFCFLLCCVGVGRAAGRSRRGGRLAKRDRAGLFGRLCHKPSARARQLALPWHLWVIGTFSDGFWESQRQRQEGTSSPKKSCSGVWDLKMRRAWARPCRHNAHTAHRHRDRPPTSRQAPSAQHVPIRGEALGKLCWKCRHHHHRIMPPHSQ